MNAHIMGGDHSNARNEEETRVLYVSGPDFETRYEAHVSKRVLGPGQKDGEQQDA